eukprot:360431-Alexandrium_andersonii.AAC.1
MTTPPLRQPIEDAALHWFREGHRLAPHDETATLALALLEQRCHQLADAQWPRPQLGSATST